MFFGRVDDPRVLQWNRLAVQIHGHLYPVHLPVQRDRVAARDGHVTRVEEENMGQRKGRRSGRLGWGRYRRGIGWNVDRLGRVKEVVVFAIGAHLDNGVTNVEQDPDIVPARRCIFTRDGYMCGGGIARPKPTGADGDFNLVNRASRRYVVEVEAHPRGFLAGQDATVPDVDADVKCLLRSRRVGVYADVPDLQIGRWIVGARLQQQPPLPDCRGVRLIPGHDVGLDYEAREQPHTAYSRNDKPKRHFFPHHRPR